MRNPIPVVVNVGVNDYYRGSGPAISSEWAVAWASYL